MLQMLMQLVAEKLRYLPDNRTVVVDAGVVGATVTLDDGGD